MLRRSFCDWLAGAFFLCVGVAMPLAAQTSAATAATAPPSVAAPTAADILRGGYGPYRANNDLLFYHLDLRVDPEKKFISGRNTIRFKMLEDGTRIQLELFPAMQIDRIVLGNSALK
jgi:hypothetical protein